MHFFVLYRCVTSSRIYGLRAELLLLNVANAEKNVIVANIFARCRKNSTTLEKFHLQISRLELYPEDSKYVDRLLHEMATKPILHVGESKLKYQA